MSRIATVKTPKRPRCAPAPRARPRRTPRRSWRRRPAGRPGCARTEALVDHDLLVDPVAARVADVGLQRRPRRDRAPLQHVGLDQRPRAVADHADRLGGLEEAAHERHRVLVHAEEVGVGDAARQHEPVVVGDVGVATVWSTVNVSALSRWLKAWTSPTRSRSAAACRPPPRRPSTARSAPPARRPPGPRGTRSSCHPACPPWGAPFSLSSSSSILARGISAGKRRLVGLVMADKEEEPDIKRENLADTDESPLGDTTEHAGEQDTDKGMTYHDPEGDDEDEPRDAVARRRRGWRPGRQRRRGRGPRGACRSRTPSGSPTARTPDTAKQGGSRPLALVGRDAGGKCPRRAPNNFPGRRPRAG